DQTLCKVFGGSNWIEKMKTMSGWLSRQWRCPRDYTVIDDSQITTPRWIDDPSRVGSTRVHAALFRHDVLSHRNQLCFAPKTVPQAIDLVTRVSSRVEFN